MCDQSSWTYLSVINGVNGEMVIIVLACALFRARHGFWSDLLHSLLLDFLQTCSSSAESLLLSASDPAQIIHTFILHRFRLHKGGGNSITETRTIAR